MKSRLLRWAILLCIGFGIGSAIGYFQAQSEMDSGVIEISPDNQTATIIKRSTSSTRTSAASTVGGAFTLIDQNGVEVTQDTYADKYKLMFFGFTYCPAVCPTELNKVSVILDELGDKADQIVPIFVSVDPERDTPDVMKNYVEQFHPSLVGLTGSQEQIDVVKDLYKVFSAKVENEMMDEYMVDHSSFLYFMGHDNKMITMYPSKDTAAEIAIDLEQQIK